MWYQKKYCRQDEAQIYLSVFTVGKEHEYHVCVEATSLQQCMLLQSTICIIFVILSKRKKVSAIIAGSMVPYSR